MPGGTSDALLEVIASDRPVVRLLRGIQGPVSVVLFLYIAFLVLGLSVAAAFPFALFALGSKPGALCSAGDRLRLRCFRHLALGSIAVLFFY